MVLNRDNHPVHRQAHLFGGALDDADIGLMRHDPIDVVAGPARPCSSAVSAVAASFSTAWRNTCVALHPQICRMCRWWIRRHRHKAYRGSARRNSDQSPECRGRRCCPCPPAPRDDQRTCAIAEQHAGGAVGPIHDPAEGFGPDHQHAVGLTRHDQRIGIGQRIDEPGTDRLHVKGKAARHAQCRLHHRGGRRKGQIRRSRSRR